MRPEPACNDWIESHFDPATSTFTHLLLDRVSGNCAIIDSVLDYDPKSGRSRTASADRLIARVRELGLTVTWILETHVHADHLTAATYLQAQLGGRIGMGNRLPAVQAIFSRVFNAGPGFATDGSQFDCLFADGEQFAVGGLTFTVWHTPGHTPACVSYVVRHGEQQAVFVGDTLFMPDTGTARCDFPGGDAAELYRSIQRLLALPPTTPLYLCHDYPPEQRPLSAWSTVAEQRAGNIHVRDGIDVAAFVELRTRRDATLEMPVLLLPSVQVNMRAGHFPPPEDNGVSYLKIPLNTL